MLPAVTSPAAHAERIRAVRDFNRNYTRSADLIAENHLQTSHSLTEARVLWELGGDAELTAGELRDRIELDAGYLSRVVSRLGEQGLIERRRSERDGRLALISLTAAGREHRATLDRRSSERVAELLDRLDETEAAELVGAMDAIGRLLSPAPAAEAVVLRPPSPGDLGWVLERHAALYSREYGWGPGFEALVADVVARFAADHDPAREAVWIAEIGGRRAGSIFCVEAERRIAKLRLLLVEPWARGRGIGALLVGECIRFARAAGYEELVLWTNDVLAHARPIYEAAGFTMTGSEAHRDFGPEVVGQNWRLTL
jgi:DNA-binding MarR family transcriptional regulator/GNAT superfamily N-acetyltransferase